MPKFNMSKIGKKPIKIAEGVKVSLEGKTLNVNGPLGGRTVVLPEGIEAVVGEKEISLTRKSDGKNFKALHGTYARLVRNAITGVREGFEKVLEIVGTGYRGQMEGNTLILSLGYSHQIKFPAPEGIKLSVEENSRLKIFGIDKNLVGTVTHNIKILRKPDSYKGKGIRYLGEKLRLKPGKAAAKAGPAAK